MAGPPSRASPGRMVSLPLRTERSSTSQIAETTASAWRVPSPCLTQTDLHPLLRASARLESTPSNLPLLRSQVDVRTGRVTTLAGSAHRGFTDGAAGEARFSWPYGCASARGPRASLGFPFLRLCRLCCIRPAKRPPQRRVRFRRSSRRPILILSPPPSSAPPAAASPCRPTASACTWPIAATTASARWTPSPAPSRPSPARAARASRTARSAPPSSTGPAAWPCRRTAAPSTSPTTATSA